MNKIIRLVILTVGFLSLARFHALAGAAPVAVPAAPAVVAPPAAPPFISTLAKLVTANKQQVVDDDVYTNQLSKWVAQQKIGRLDVTTIFGLQAADPTINQADLLHLEGILDSLAPPLNAQINFTTATNNFDLSVTNQPLVSTNLAGAINDQRRLMTTISVPGNSPDAGMFTSLTNDWDMMVNGERAYALPSTNTPVSSPYQAFIASGAEFVNPFQIVVPAGAHFGTLTNAGHSTVGFVEFDYINRHILRPGRMDPTAKQPNKYGFFNPLGDVPDVQFQLGFLFDNGTTVTNGQTYSAQSLAGADFYTQMGLGFPLWRHDLPTQSHQVSLEASGGMTTEQSFEHVHPNAFVGLGYETSFSPFIGSATTNVCGFLVTKIGAGWADLPATTGTSNYVYLDGNGNPRFDFRPNWEMSAYLAYPLTSKVYLTVEANTFVGNNQPDSWNIKVGASIPLDSMSTIFSSVIKSVGGSP